MMHSSQLQYSEKCSSSNKHLSPTSLGCSHNSDCTVCMLVHLHPSNYIQQVYTYFRQLHRPIFCLPYVKMLISQRLPSAELCSLECDSQTSLVHSMKGCPTFHRMFSPGVTQAGKSSSQIRPQTHTSSISISASSSS